MSLSQVSVDALDEEGQIQQEIFNAIDDYQNIVFNAGAGAGKTYELIESLKYIIQSKGEKLTYHNQQVICITYTNVATDEIKQRLGNTRLIKVSTIHERLWDLIKEYQKQLVIIHINKLKEESEKLENDLATDSKFQAYRDLKDKEFFKNIILENKSIFYQSRDKPAAKFRSVTQCYLSGHDDLLSNVTNFKSLVGKIFSINNFENCLGKLRRGELELVHYDSRYNSDRLHSMMISHDTLLEYSYKLIARFDLIKQIILDKYPYILVDEYQDTNENVVKILKLLSDYSFQIKHKLFIGYFGDTAQNIYESGVGNNLNEIHPNLLNIYKKFNRRSVNKVLSVINKIRNDEIQQESIYSDADDGTVGFYQGNIDQIDNFIEQCKTEWDINQNNRLHCLVLTNELVAKYNHFEYLYQKLKNTKYYKIYWNSLNTEVLSHDLSKLGVIPRLLYRIIDFKIKVNDPKTSIIDLIHQSLYNELTLVELKTLLGVLKSAERGNIYEFLEAVFLTYNDTENENYKKVIEQLFDLETWTFASLKDHMLTTLFPNVEEDDIEVSKDGIKELLSVDYGEYLSWFQFINKMENQDVIYHTYHGTKGEEYDNVIVLMKNDFGVMGQKKFSSFFTGYLDSDKLVAEDLEKFINTRNLLYVSCSRAIKNLRVLYLDDVSSFNDGVKAIFQEVQEFKN